MPYIPPPFEERIRESITLSGSSDPRVFTSDEYFVENTIEVMHNGRALEKTTSDSPAEGDYVISESGGVGTGYDTVTFLRITPSNNSKIRANFISDE